MIASTSRIGHILLQEGVVSPEVLQEASVLQAKFPEDRICEILVDRLGVDHHQVFSRLARIYAFKEFKFEVDSIGDKGLHFIKATLDALPEEVRQKALEKKVIPLKVIDQRKEMLMVVTSDATNRETTAIASRFGFRRPEIFYSQQRLIDELIEKGLPAYKRVYGGSPRGR